MRLSWFCLVVPAIGVAATAFAADADNGKRIVEARCVACHAVMSRQRRELGEAPSFEAIAGKFAVSPELLAFSILDPHPRMNVMLTRPEARDIAAYINTLAK